MKNIIVCFKQIIDIDQIKIDRTTSEPILAQLPYKIEDMSKTAIEEAMRLKEKYGGKVTGIMFADEKTASMAMKEALAMGVDEGIIIKGYKRNNPRLTAMALAEIIKKQNYDVIITGTMAADSYTGLVPSRLATLLNLPFLGAAIKIELNDQVVVTRTLEDHNESVISNYPVLISVVQEINEPRLPSLMQIMAAGRKPVKIENISLEDLVFTQVLENKAPKSERKRQIYEDVDKGIEEVTKIIRGEIR